MTGYVLHYAPDNASLIVRLALEELGLSYETRLVDRSRQAQRGAAFRALNPVGRIPALETPDGPIFETAAILLHLADRHGGLAPAPRHPLRGRFLSWLFFLSNSVHAEMRILFHADGFAGPDPDRQGALHGRVAESLCGHFALLDAECAAGRVLGGATPSGLDLYVAALLRWCALYPRDGDRSWFDPGRWPTLRRLAIRLEGRESAARLIAAEGLGPTPFSDPHPPNPPEGSAT